MAKAIHLLRKAGELVRARKFQEAVEFYLQATEADSLEPRGWFGLGVCLYRVGNIEVARIALERADRMGHPKAQAALLRLKEAEQRRMAEGKGAKASVTPGEAQQRAAGRPAAAQSLRRRREDKKVELDRFLRVMLVEGIRSDRQAIVEAIEGNIEHIEVAPVPYGVTTSDTMSSTVRHDVAILNWDMAPDAAAGLIQILKIKRPTLLVICMTEGWDSEAAVQILQAGADYHLVKEPHFAGALPLIIAQWARRDSAVARRATAERGERQEEPWPAALNALGEMLVAVRADYTIQRANIAAMTGLKKAESELVGQPYSRSLYATDEPPATCPLLQALQTGEPASAEVRNDDLGTTLSVRAWPVMSAGAKPTGVVALLRGAEPAPPSTTVVETMDFLSRVAAEKANAGLAVIGPQGELEYVNEGLCKMLGHSREELIGSPIEAMVSVRDHESLRGALDSAEELGASGDRLNLQRADGSTIPVEARMASFDTEGGTSLALTAIGVSELEEAEGELWAETRKLSVVLDEGMDRLRCGIVVLDGNERIAWLNSVAAGLFGGDKAGLIGRDYIEMATHHLPDTLADSQRFIDRIAAVHKSEEALEGHLLRMGIGPEAETVEYWSTPVEGGLLCAKRVEHFYPVSGAQLAQPAPAGGAGVLAGIAAAAPEMLFTTDPEGKIKWCNPAASGMLGYDEDKLHGMALAGLAAADAREKLARMFQQSLLSPGRTVRGELLMERGDGRRFWGELTLLPVPAEQEGAPQDVGGILRDVTEQKVNETIRSVLAGDVPAPAPGEP